MGLTAQQLAVLARPINSARVATRSASGRTLSYLEAWDVKAHLIRVFGYAGFDAELVDYHWIATREYAAKDDKAMVEVIYAARVRLTLRDPEGNQVAVYTEGAVGSTSGPDYLLGDHHDNALKTAESDALKRCAVYLGNQFGASLYDNGSKLDVVKGTVLDPPKEKTPDEVAAEQATTDQIASSLGATVIPEEGTP